MGGLHVGGDLVLGRHVVVEPDEAEDDAHGLGDALVIGKGHGLMEGHFDHFDHLPLLRQASALAHAVLVRHLGVEHGLLGSCHTFAGAAEREVTHT